MGSILVWEDPLEKGKATHSSILAWRIPWTIHVHGVAESWTWLSDFHFHFAARTAEWHSSGQSKARGKVYAFLMKAKMPLVPAPSLPPSSSLELQCDAWNNCHIVRVRGQHFSQAGKVGGRRNMDPWWHCWAPHPFQNATSQILVKWEKQAPSIQAKFPVICRWKYS